MANFILQHERCWDQGESIGKDHRLIATEKTKHSSRYRSLLLKRVYIDREIEPVRSVRKPSVGRSCWKPALLQRRGTRGGCAAKGRITLWKRGTWWNFYLMFKSCLWFFFGLKRVWSKGCGPLIAGLPDSWVHVWCGFGCEVWATNRPDGPLPPLIYGFQLLRIWIRFNVLFDACIESAFPVDYCWLITVTWIGEIQGDCGVCNQWYWWAWIKLIILLRLWKDTSPELFYRAFSRR